jgi:hypothetical protein
MLSVDHRRMSVPSKGDTRERDSYRERPRKFREFKETETLSGRGSERDRRLSDRENEIGRRGGQKDQKDQKDLRGQRDRDNYQHGEPIDRRHSTHQMDWSNSSLRANRDDASTRSRSGNTYSRDKKDIRRERVPSEAGFIREKKQIEYRKNEEEFESRNKEFDYVIPRNNRYFMHDDRGGPLLASRSVKKDFGNGLKRKLSDTSDSSSRWKHDKFAELENRRPRKYFYSNIRENTGIKSGDQSQQIQVQSLEEPQHKSQEELSVKNLEGNDEKSKRIENECAESQREQNSVSDDDDNEANEMLKET